ncbi:MAG: sporulation protein YqfD [Clostridiales bacterium]|nr:sporulation protein YqfD [Clostridiales bacterium]
MRQSLTHFLRGYLWVRVSGCMPERFFNLCRFHQIEIWDIRCREHCHDFLVSFPDYRGIRPVVRKSRMHCKIIGKYGLPFLLYRNRKRKLFAAGLLLFFLMLGCMSRFIWDVTILDNRSVTDDTMLHYLADQNIGYGVRKKLVDCERLEENIRLDFPDIIWVSARISGNRLIIRVKENTLPDETIRQEEEAADLIADCDGVITDMIVRQGKAQVRVGDTVTEGQILVSGAIPITDDSGETVSWQYVCADADIKVLTVREVTKKIPTLISIRSSTGKGRRGMGVKIGSLSFVWMIPKSEGSLWKTFRETWQVTLFGDFYLPVWVSMIRSEEYQIYERPRTEKEQESEILHFTQEVQQNFAQKGVVIIQNDVKILDSLNGCELRGTFVSEEPAGKRQRLDAVQLDRNDQK